MLLVNTGDKSEVIRFQGNAYNIPPEGSQKVLDKFYPDVVKELTLNPNSQITIKKVPKSVKKSPIAWVKGLFKKA